MRQHEVRNHFAIPPFTFLELKNVPGAHVVLIVAGRDGRAAEPGAVLHHDEIRRRQSEDHPGGARRHQGSAGSDPQRHQAAVEIYKEVTGDKTSVEDLLAWLKEPGMMEWNLQPQGTMKFAAHLFKTGTLKTQPKAWTDYYLPVAHDLKGN